MTQTSRVLNYLKEHGSITEGDAYRELGCSRLSARIYNLRYLGFDIKTIYETSKNRWGDTVRYARYTLMEGTHEKEPAR